jgi:hypothetical protein
MIQPLNLELILSVDRDKGEKLVLIKTNEMIAEINRLEQLMNFLAEVSARHEEPKEDDVQ